MKKPKVGQTWAYGDATGRPVRIERIKRGICGRWKAVGKRFEPQTKKTRCVWIFPCCGGTPMAANIFMRSFVYVRG